MTELTEAGANTLSNTQNVANRNGKLRIQFKLPDKYYTIWRSTGLDTTVKNIPVASSKLVSIKTDIELGIYDRDPEYFWLKHFPLSKQAQATQKIILLSDLFTQFEEDRDHELGYSIMSKLTTCKNWVKQSGLYNKPVEDITSADLNAMRKKSLRGRKSVTVKEYSQLLRQVISTAITNDIITKDPFDGVRKLPKDEFDVEDEYISPFSKSELKKLLDVIHIPQTKRLIEFLAWTGLRHGEAKALAWEDIDFHNNYLKVRYSIDRKGTLKPPKTRSSVRKVALLPVVVKLLKEQMERSYNEKEIVETVHYKNYRTTKVSRRRVFLSRGKIPFKRPEITTTRDQWTNWIKAAGVTYRPPYQLRHTFASQMLTAKAELTWLAKQMGHKNWGHIQTVYGRWIEDESPDYIKELAKQLGQEYEEN